MTARASSAVVLAGGASSRMGGFDKTALHLDGRPLLDRVLAAVVDIDDVVVVGPSRATSRPVRWCREDPPRGGPAAGLAAALPLIDAPFFALLAGDLPLVDSLTVQSLLRPVASGVADGTDGAVAVDGQGRPQWLLSAWRTAAVRRLPLGAGMSLRATLGTLTWVPVVVPADAVLDCDTPVAFRRIRARAAPERSNERRAAP